MENENSKIKTNQSKEHHKEVDNFIITACISLLAAYVVMISIKKSSDNLLCYSTSVSIFCLLVALLEFLWYKVRWYRRIEYLENEHGEIINKYAKDITHTLNHYMSIRKLAEAKEKEIENLDTDKKVVKEYDKREEDPSYKIIYSFCKNLSTDMQDAHNKFIKKPLKEKFARIKYVVDISSKNTRYHFFVIGVVFFFISVILNMTR